MFKQLKRLLVGSLRRQLMLGMVLVVSVMMSLFVWDLTRQQQAEALDRQSERAVALARSVAVSSAVWVLARDFAGLQDIVDGLVQYPDLRYAMVLDSSGRVLAHSDPSRFGQYLTDLSPTAALTVFRRDVQLVDVATPVMMEGRQIGWVRISLAGDLLAARLDQIRRNGIFYTLLALVLTVVLAYLSSRYLTRRLRAIARVAHAVQAGNTGLRATVVGEDEAARLARQFNDMLDTLARRDQALKDSEAFKDIVLDSVAAEVVVLDGQGRIVAVNKHWRRFAVENSRVPNEPAGNTGVGANYLDACRGESYGAQEARNGILAVLDGQLSRFSLEYPCASPGQQRWFTMVATPLGADAERGVTITHSDITAVKEVQQHEEFHGRVLELMASAAPLHEVLAATVLGVEQLHPAMLCSILLLDDTGQRLGQGVAPSLPDFYNAAINDTPIGPGVGSCGTAAFSGERVVVEDIAVHPYWVNFKALAAQAKLAACWSQPILSSAGRVLGTFAIYHREVNTPSFQDIVVIEKAARLAGIAIEHKQTQAALKASEDTFRTLFETAPHGVVYQDWSGRITSANPAAQRILGLTLDQLQGRTSMDPRWQAIREDGSPIPGEQHPITQALKTGQPVKDVLMGVPVPGRDVVWILVSAMPLFKDGQVAQAYAIFEDITDRHQLQQEVRQMAFYDPLTQLPNRRLLTDRLNQAMTASKRSACYGALMFLDLDNFKPLNDSHGHEMGDMLLKEAAQRLKHCVREVDTAARFGGDEFVVMLVDLDTDQARSRAQAESVAEKIRTSLAQPYVLTYSQAGSVPLTIEHHCTVSIGIAMYIHHEGTPADFLQRADAAMYQAKDAGRNTLRFYSPPA